MATPQPSAAGGINFEGNLALKYEKEDGATGAPS
jgi:hypothetical protein